MKQGEPSRLLGTSVVVYLIMLALAALFGASRRDARVALALALGVAAVAVLVFVSRPPFPEAVLAGVGTLLAFGLVAARGLRAPRLLLALSPVLLLTIFIYGVELNGRARRARLVSWGDVFRGEVADPAALGSGGRFKPSLSVRMHSNEHPYAGARFVTNAQGFRNEGPIEEVPPAGERRILNIGDSFSLGFELSQDEFLGALVEKQLQATSPQVRVLNAHVDDPGHGLLYLERSGLAFRPQVVLMGICSNDPMQTEEFLGPTRRFMLPPDGTVALNPDYRASDPLAESRALVYSRPASFGASYLQRHAAPSSLARNLGELELSRLLAPPNREFPSILYSYVYDEEKRDGHKRLLDGTSNLAYYSVQPADIVRATYDRLFSVLRVMSARCAAANARLAVVLFPEKLEVHPEEWQAMREFWGLVESDFDLDLPHRRLRELCKSEGIECIDLGPELRRVAREQPGTLYFPLGDIHLNAVGVRVASRVVAERLDRMTH